MTPEIGYCTNVHAGSDLQQTRENLAHYAVAVQRRRKPARPMGVGLWLSDRTARQLTADGQLDEFAQWLAGSQLVPYTFNGFPYGDFHQARVKHNVYLPTWRQRDRREYTLRLVDILHRLLPAGAQGSISTLPIQWGQPAATPEELAAAADNLIRVARRLERLEDETGRLIYLCLEPEPGCVLQRSTDVVRFYQDYLFAQDSEGIVRRYLRICHDVCHAAVMFESQYDVLRRYQQAGIQVGKMQISAGIAVDFDALAPTDRREAIGQLRSFAEDRYLHQTVIRQADGRQEFHEDLPPLVAATDRTEPPRGRWRIHFHVPIYLERFGLLETTQADIAAALEAARRTAPQLKHFEVETYAWGVLPAAIQVADLSEGISQELAWLNALLQRTTP